MVSSFVSTRVHLTALLHRNSMQGTTTTPIAVSTTPIQAVKYDCIGYIAGVLAVLVLPPTRWRMNGTTNHTMRAPTIMLLISRPKGMVSDHLSYGYWLLYQPTRTDATPGTPTPRKPRRKSQRAITQPMTIAPVAYSVDTPAILTL